jgi:hypothetical protein
VHPRVEQEVIDRDVSLRYSAAATPRPLAHPWRVVGQAVDSAISRRTWTSSS